LTGFDDKELDKLLYEEKEGLTDEDAVPEEVEPRVKQGELWQLGNHRLLCGDATSEADVKKLLNNIYPDLIHTDPPYGMNAVTKSGVLKKNYKTDIMGDNDPEIAKKSFKLIQELYNRSYQIWWGANYYSSVLPDSECWLVWDKNNGQSDQTDCELAYANFRSVIRQFTLSSEKKNRVHPTQKPVSLYNWVFEKFKLSSSTMLDLFGGSGTAIIASEIKKIQSYTMEFDTKYCDVIIKRWEDFTGQTAKLLERGTDTNSLKEEAQWQDQKNIKSTEKKSLN
jgi:DNA modification methylase